MSIVQVQDLGSVMSSIPAILREAAKSPLGLVALLIVLVGATGLLFFYKDDHRYRFAVFVLLFAGAAAFSYQLMSTQHELTQDKLTAAWQDSVNVARHNPRIAEFSVQLQFPPHATIPIAVESFMKQRGQRSFVEIDSQKFRRIDDPTNHIVTMQYDDLPAGAVLKLVATDGAKKWVAPDTRVPETRLQMARQ